MDFKGNGGTRDCCKHGDRIPAVLHDERNNELIFCSSVNGNGNYHVKYKVELHRWYTIIIKQILTLRQVRIDAKDLNNTHFTRFTLLSELMEKNSSKLKIKIPRHLKTSRSLQGTILCQQQMSHTETWSGKIFKTFSTKEKKELVYLETISHYHFLFLFYIWLIFFLHYLWSVLNIFVIQIKHEFLCK